MAKETMARIFTPYFTTKAEGTGLGLSIVERVAKAHGASIDVESRASEGTTISITFSALDEDHVSTRSHH
jgi:two-component system sensor histidine kinase HydH